ncbi:uncharacterized protein PAC_11823 [Phialocephala subalpina]|uniref:Uncharacterized protein n=1 Tax=Phialocephala subalpina TaxID=576137 RepID=A0A1L7XAB7_9HELO|nr:uncharacterized protein PAC_11823 [Phialocephala subalpina]
MAQPSGKICGIPSRYRIYLASSPILCLADAIFALIRLVTTFISLLVGLKKRFQLVAHARLGSERIGEEAHQSPPEAKTWPRWMFFIMGPLPAAIKLASFSGTPWTKTWGLMFVSSFVVTELVAMIARSSTTSENTTVESILGLSALECEDPQNAPLRLKVVKVSEYLRNFEIAFFILSVITHIVFLAWGVETLWRPCTSFINSSPLAHEILAFIKAVIVLSFLIVTLFWVLLFCCFRIDLTKQHFLSRVWNMLFRTMVGSFLLPGTERRVQKPRAPGEKGPAIPPPPGWLKKTSDVMAIWLYLFGIAWAFHWGLSRVCDRWPGVAKVLLLDVRPLGVGATQEEETRERNAATGGGELGSIHDSAWISFCFFLMNLGTCVLWYAFMYDERGTVNPSWTDVFG